MHMFREFDHSGAGIPERTKKKRKWESGEIKKDMNGLKWTRVSYVRVYRWNV